MKPYFSIIVPVYNAEKYMTKGLESIKYAIEEYVKIGGNAQLIIICDSCTDNSLTIAKYYTPYVYEVNYHKDGLTRNKGLDIVESVWFEKNQNHWILFMDDDDWWLHEYVLCQMAQQIKYSDHNVGCWGFSFIWKGLGYIKPIRTNGTTWPAVWNKIWRKDAISGCRFSDKWSQSDMDFNQEVRKKWKNQEYIFVPWDMPFYYYNFLRKGSITQSDGKLTIENIKL